MITALVTIIHITKVLLSGAKWILPRGISSNGVNVMKLTNVVGFTKPRKGFIFFIIDIVWSGESGKNHNDKEVKNK